MAEKSIFKYDSDDLEQLEWEYLSENTRKIFDIISLVLSILAGIASFLLIDYGLLILVLPGVVLDISLTIARMVVGQWLINHEYKLENDLTYLGDYVCKLEAKFKSADVQNYFTKNCRGCYNSEQRSDGTWRCYRSSRCDGYCKYFGVQDKYLKYSKMLEEKQKAAAVELAKKSTKKSAEYDDKLKYFETMILKINDFASTVKVKVSRKNAEETTPDPQAKLRGSLKTIVKSLQKVQKILGEKPESLVVVSRNLYVYLDELQLILNKFAELSPDMQIQYIDEIEKVCVALNDNINHTIRRLENYDTEKLEISLETLLKELVKENEEEEENA